MLKNKKKQEESDYNISFLPFYAYKFTSKRQNSLLHAEMIVFQIKNKDT